MNDQEYEVYEAAIQVFPREPDILNMLVTMERLTISAGAALVDGTLGPLHCPWHVWVERRAVVSRRAAVECLESLRARRVMDKFTADPVTARGTAASRGAIELELTWPVAALPVKERT